MNVNLSYHAAERARARGIERELIEQVALKGRKIPNGVNEYVMQGRGISVVVVLVGDSAVVKTAYKGMGGW